MCRGRQSQYVPRQRHIVVFHRREETLRDLSMPDALDPEED